MLGMKAKCEFQSIILNEIPLAELLQARDERDNLQRNYEALDRSSAITIKQRDAAQMQLKEAGKDTARLDWFNGKRFFMFGFETGCKLEMRQGTMDFIDTGSARSAIDFVIEKEK